MSTPDEVYIVECHDGQLMLQKSGRQQSDAVRYVRAELLDIVSCPVCEDARNAGLPCDACNGHGYVYAEKGAKP